MQEKNEKRIRVSNVFLRNLESKTKITVNQGGTRCFHPDTHIVTDKGNVKISDIKQGDFVLSYNESLKINEFKKVVNTFKLNNNKKTIKLKLKNGSVIIATIDHKFYVDGGWRSLNSIIHDKRNMEKNT